MKNKLSVKIVTKFMLAIVGLSALQSCVKDNFNFDKIAEVKWNPNLAIPLVYSSMTIDDILKTTEEDGSKSYIQTESDNSITVIYETNVLTQDASVINAFSVNDAGQVDVPIIIPGGGGLVTATGQKNIVLNTGSSGAEIDSVTFKAGFLNITLNNPGISGNLTISIPSASKNGVVFNQNIALPSNNNASFDLTDYTFDLTQVSGGPAFNQFDVNFTINATGGGPGTITVSTTMSGMKFKRMFGYFGNQTISSLSDTIPLRIFGNSTGGTFSLANPKVIFKTFNSFGIPIDASLTSLTGQDPGSNPIINSPFTLPIGIPAFPSQIGQTIADSGTLDNSNSNIVSVFSNTPKEMGFTTNISSNPGSVTHTNFIIDTNKFKLNVQAELPLYGWAKGFTLVDTLPLSIGKLNEQAESGLLRIYSSNGFPLDLEVQIYFTDSLYNRLDSLINPNQLVLVSGTLNTSTGRVTSPTEKTIDVTFDKAKLNRLVDCKNIIIKASANTSNPSSSTIPPNVKIYADYALLLKLGIQIKADININPNK